MEGLQEPWRILLQTALPVPPLRQLQHSLDNGLNPGRGHHWRRLNTIAAFFIFKLGKPVIRLAS
jgi:hypothetical protein